MHPALLAAGSVRDASVAGRPVELPRRVQAPRGTLPCGTPIPGLFGTSHSKWSPTAAPPPLGFGSFHSTCGRIRVVLTALSSEELTLTRVSVPRCRSSSGCPVGCGASFDRVRDCSRVAELHPFSGCLFAGGRPLQRLRVEGQQNLRVLPVSWPRPFVGGPTEGCPSPRRGRITEVLRCRC